MTDNYVQLKKDNVLRIGIKNQKGEDTNVVLEFDMEDIELPLKYQKMNEMHKKNLSNIKNQTIIIDKRQDVKGKKLLSKNEEDKIKAMKEFYDKEMEALDIFIGEGKTKQILNAMGRNPYISMFNDIRELLDSQKDLFESRYTSIENKIKEKYKEIESNVLK